MKPIFRATIIWTLVIGFSMTSRGQSVYTKRPNALGIRYGSARVLKEYNSIFEFSYQRYLTEPRRIELDASLGISSELSSFSIIGAYQWMLPIDREFRWFLGPAAGFRWNGEDDKSYFALGVGVQLGLQYDFTGYDVPLLLSFDLRPMMQLAHTVGPRLDPGFGLAARYMF